MSARIFLSFLPKVNYAKSFTSWDRLGLHSYSNIAQKVELKVQESFKNMKTELSFEQFKEKKVKSFEEFKQSPGMKALFDDDIEKILNAYQDYCVCKFNRYQQSQYGGNPSSML